MKSKKNAAGALLAAKLPVTQKQAVVIISGVVAIGLLLLYYTHAAVNAVSVSAAAGALSGTTRVVPSANASDGKLVQFGISTAAGEGQSSGGQASGSNGGTSYVQPHTQGYRGLISTLTVYSAANGRTPNGCSWRSYGLVCGQTNLTLDHVYVKGGLYWNGCGTLTLTNSIFDWQPHKSNWYDVDAACTSPDHGASVIASNDTFETGPPNNGVYPTYTGGSDVGGIWSYAIPTYRVSNSLIAGFPQGFDPSTGSVIKSNEIYTQNAICGSSACHEDGLFSQGGDDLTYEYNYIVTPSYATAAIFYQSRPNSSGNSVIGNYLRGGSYSLYNENSNGVTVRDNFFAGSTYGDCSLWSGASWGTWSGNHKPGGVVVTPSGNGCN